MNIADCTVTEKILLASHQLEQEGQSPFSAEALVVACWKKFPNTFGLKGFADQYPDSNKVLTSIMGERGLARRGWLDKKGQKLYALTQDGRAIAQRLLRGDEEPAPAPRPRPSKVTRELEKFLFGLFSSTATEKYEEGRKAEITFADACAFWDINDMLRGEELEDRLQRFDIQLHNLATLTGDGETELSNGMVISSHDIDRLVDLHNHLEQRFSRHLHLLRSRV
ncbi:MAG: hypothetical protein KatS3mg105_4530 [Gemmatales bacterium]|nr:MAG: hypothetical protein KatS3mg105_4530 [Gemmatales bacterium]